jgi:hypothetical protein
MYLDFVLNWTFTVVMFTIKDLFSDHSKSWPKMTNIFGIPLPVILGTLGKEVHKLF